MARGLLGFGREQKRQALAGLTRSAELEQRQEAAQMQLDAQRRAAQMNVVGTAGGIVGAEALASRLGGEAAKEVGKQVVAETAKQAAASTAASTAAGTAATTAAGTAGTTAATTAAAGAGGTGALASVAAAAPYVALAIAGGYLLKRLFD